MTCSSFERTTFLKAYVYDDAYRLKSVPGTRQQNKKKRGESFLFSLHPSLQRRRDAKEKEEEEESDGCCCCILPRNEKKENKKSSVDDIFRLGLVC